MVFSTKSTTYGQKWFFRMYPDIKLYYGNNVFVKLTKLQNFLSSEIVVDFLSTNYIITCVLYTVFEACKSPINFGLYKANEWYAWFVMFTNLLIHHGMFVFAVIFFVKMDTKKSKTFLHILVPAIYLVLYCVTVKIIGVYAYRIEWYPYGFFHPELIKEMVGLQDSNINGNLLVAAVFVALIAIYAVTYFAVYKLKRKNKK